MMCLGMNLSLYFYDKSNVIHNISMNRKCRIPYLRMSFNISTTSWESERSMNFCSSRWNLISYRNNIVKSWEFLLLGMISIIMSRITYNGAKFKRFFAIQKNQRICKKRKSEKTFTTFACILDSPTTYHIYNNSFLCVILSKLFTEDLSTSYYKFCCMSRNLKSFRLIFGR